MANLFGNGYQISHLLPVDDIEDVAFPRVDIRVGRCDLIVFGDRPADGAELAFERVGHQNANAMAMKAPRQR